MTKYALIAGLIACLGLGGAAWGFQASAARLRAENDDLRTTVSALETERDLAREARDVADARRRASEAKASEYDQIREGILRHGEDINLADMPQWFRDALVRVLGNNDTPR